VFIVLTGLLSDEQFFSYGWRIPFLASALLVLVGLYVRLSLEETPAFRNTVERNERVRIPLLTVLRQHTRTLIVGMLASFSVFVLFYLMTVFALSWGTSRLGYSRDQFLLIQQLGVIAFAAAVPLSALLAERGRRTMLMGTSLLIALFGLVMPPLFEAGLTGAIAAVVLGMAVMGLAFGPLGTFLSELFPTAVRYTGSSLTFNLAGIFGASFAPYIATWLATRYGLQYVGYYLMVAALLTFIGLLAARNAKV